MKKFFFVTLEGIDGAGKTTQASIVADMLTSRGYEVFSFREPGSTELGNEVRKLLFNKVLELNDYTELFLFMAARAELINKVLSKAKPDSIVIGDRFWDSTIAYQHYGKGLSLDIIRQIKNTPPFSATPDITFWLDIPIDLSTQREEGDSNISNHNALLLNKVRNGFKAIYESEPERIVKIDGTADREAVSNKIIKLIENSYNHKKKHG